MLRLASLVLTSAVAVFIATPAGAQTAQSRCADCHFANPDSPRQDHLSDWDISPHGRASVGCEKCHGGNSTTFEPLPAHSAILGPANARSPVNRRNLPTTCGGCHVGPFAAFQDSRHYQLLQEGNERGPTCSTCHSEVSGQLLSAKALATRCNWCHGPGETAPRAERARVVRDQYEALSTVRNELKLAQSLIRRVSDKARRTELTNAYDQAQSSVTRAVNAGHKFVYDDLRDELAAAQKRAEALLSRLANR